MLRIDVKSSRELQALILSVRQANREVQTQIRQHTRTMARTEWTKALGEQAQTRLEFRVLVDTARVTVSNQNVKLKSGGLAKKLTGGGRPYQLFGGAEFGAGLSTVQQRSRKGRAYKRTSGQQFRYPNKKGYVVYPAAAQIIPRIAALWVQTAVRTFHEALEQKG